MIRRLVLLAVLATLAAPAAATAKDPHRWHFIGTTAITPLYLQGIAAAPNTGPLFWSGPIAGFHRTDRTLGHPADNSDAIPPDVNAREGYNHIGDLAYDARRGRLILPLECYDPNARPTNTCGHGGFGVGDPHTLAWRYYVNAAVPKAVWAATSPDGKLVWTSTGDDPGDDVLAFRAADITPANAGKRISPVRRLKHAVPASGVSGGVVSGHRLYLAGGALRPREQVWSVDLRTGSKRLEIERHVDGESEGVELTWAFGGSFQWVFFGYPTASDARLFTFLPRAPLHVAVDPGFAAAGRRTRFAVSVTHTVLGRRRAVRGALVRIGGARATTNAKGRAVVRARLPHRGRFRVRAAWRGDRGSAAILAGSRVRGGSGLG